MVGEVGDSGLCVRLYFLLLFESFLCHNQVPAPSSAVGKELVPGMNRSDWLVHFLQLPRGD